MMMRRPDHMLDDAIDDDRLDNDPLSVLEPSAPLDHSSIGALLSHIRSQLDAQREAVSEAVNPTSAAFVSMAGQLERLQNDIRKISEELQNASTQIFGATTTTANAATEEAFPPSITGKVPLARALNSAAATHRETASKVDTLSHAAEVLKILIEIRLGLDRFDAALLSEYDTAADIITRIEELMDVVPETEEAQMLHAEVAFRKAKLYSSLEVAQTEFYSIQPNSIKVLKRISGRGRQGSASSSDISLDHVWHAQHRLGGLNTLMTALAKDLDEGLLAPLFTAAKTITDASSLTARQNHIPGADATTWTWTVTASDEHQGASSSETSAVGGVDVAAAAADRDECRQLRGLVAVLENLLCFVETNFFQLVTDAFEMFAAYFWSRLTQRLSDNFVLRSDEGAAIVKKFEIAMKARNLIPPDVKIMTAFATKQSNAAFVQRRTRTLDEIRSLLLSSTMCSMTVQVSDATLPGSITNRNAKHEAKASPAEEREAQKHDDDVARKIAESQRADVLSGLVISQSLNDPAYGGSGIIPSSGTHTAGTLRIDGKTESTAAPSGVLGLAAESVACSSYSVLANCAVSVAADRTVKTLTHILDEAVQSWTQRQDKEGAEKLLQSARDVASLFVAIRPTAHRELLRSNASFVCLLYTDCYYMAHYLTLATFSYGTKLPSSLAPRRFYFDLVVALNALQRCTFLTFLRREKNTTSSLLKPLKEALRRIAQDTHFAHVETTLAGAMQRIKNFSAAAVAVLPFSVYGASLGLLLDAFLRHLMDIILSLQDMPARDSAALALLVASTEAQVEAVLTLHRSWQPESDILSAETGGGTSRPSSTATTILSAPDAVRRYASSWNAFRLLAKLLNADYGTFLLHKDALRKLVTPNQLKCLLGMSKDKLPHSVHHCANQILAA